MHFYLCFLRITAAFLIVSVGCPAMAGPNVIVIVVDDLGAADLGVEGAADLQTPTIDMLAIRGCDSPMPTRPRPCAVRRARA